jgi:hypothetical protein
MLGVRMIETQDQQMKMLPVPVPVTVQILMLAFYRVDLDCTVDLIQRQN